MTAPAVSAAPSAALADADSPRTIGEALPVFLRHGSPRILLAALAVALPLRLAVGQWSFGDLLAVALLVAYWPIQEWLIHVFILHFQPRQVLGRTLDFRVPRKHREHHRRPWDIDILFIPMHSFLYSLPLVVGLWFLLAPTTPIALTGIAAHLLLSLHYEWVHYLVHTRVQPRTALYQRLWRNHRLHHFKNEHYWFGVTMLSGDRLLRTAPAVKDVETSPTAR
ncbi:MAG: sterol desaturase family protein, partial [Deltaproteobacteria bacterium]|nr:sterol desaturase family protein [Deltaproteobacteria bacterium]